MNRDYYIIYLASKGIKPEDADPPLEEGYEIRAYNECVSIIKTAEEEGRQVVLFAPSDY